MSYLSFRSNFLTLKLFIFASYVFSLDAETAVKNTPFTYVVLQRSNETGLIRVFPDGASKTIAKLGGLSLATDGQGNYVVGTVNRITRVTPDGDLTLISDAPGGVIWDTVIYHPKGYFIVSEPSEDRLWRVSQDGRKVTVLAHLPPGNKLSTPTTGLVMGASGECIYMRSDASQGPQAYIISESGEIRTLVLAGAIDRPGSAFLKHNTQRAVTGGRIIGDGQGYIFIDSPPTFNVFRLNASGVVEKLGNVSEGYKLGRISALARNPSTGDFILALSRTLLPMKQSGELGPALYVPMIPFPEAILVELTKALPQE